ncbi:DUF5799 family protein [Halobacteria archaeon AArc-curdl1]|uniref:DUF5799 family protein n=1 Tax=Natronosalvus hydrolyticus TaxID=2979988 RepID=A0AAP2ZC50_9EURY|nr:DUF5799 family protein [Halobacteria archaeon AArc-curdl1]
MANSWSDRVVGERMTVDREFSSRVESSRFTSQEWSLIMTATEFEIENPDDPETARVVANTDKVEQILPELENIRNQAGAMGADPGAGSSSSGGFLSSIKSALGMGGEASYDEEREAAETLTQEYAQQLQAKIEANGRWEEVCSLAAE